MELSVNDYHKAEKHIDYENQKLLKSIGETYGRQILDEIEYELFADTGSVGLHQIVTTPKGSYKDGIGLQDCHFKGAWFDDTAGICEHTKDSFDYSCYMKIKDGVFFKYNAIE